jgi:hypothetical protein
VARGAQDRIEITEERCKLIVDPGPQRRAGITERRDKEIEQDRRHRRAFGKMHELKVPQRVIRARRREPGAAAMGFAQILHDGPRFLDDPAIDLKQR